MKPEKKITYGGLRSKTTFMEPKRSAIDDNGVLTFRFLNHSEAFPGKVKWSDAGRDRLWNYNLHYFDYLMSGGIGAETAERLIRDWIDANPAGAPDAWDPFPISLRIVNWLKYASLKNIKLPDTAIDRLTDQCRWLEKNIEYHLLGNHLFKNGKALIFAGLGFRGDLAQQWLTKGKRIIAKEVAEQVLADGGHFERSPMYHAMILEDILDLLNIIPEDRSWLKLRGLLHHAAARMVRFLDSMTHPDGQIALFNDAALNIEAAPARLIEYYERITSTAVERSRHAFTGYPLTGYFVLSPNNHDRMMIDCGRIGPEYQPGHAHCDTLSFELSLFGQRVIVDSGCYQYKKSDIRRYNRGNSGHNTLTIDSHNQSEIWNGHRCGRRAYPLNPEIYQQEDGTLVFQGAHDGYRRIKGRPIHRRRIEWNGRQIVIADHIEGRGRHDIEWRLHLHPDLTIANESKTVTVSASDRSIMKVDTLGKHRVTVAQGWYCPEFGLKRECPLLSFKLTNIRLPVSTGWVFNIIGIT